MHITYCHLDTTDKWSKIFTVKNIIILILLILVILFSVLYASEKNKQEEIKETKVSSDNKIDCEDLEEYKESKKKEKGYLAGMIISIICFVFFIPVYHLVAYYLKKEDKKYIKENRDEIKDDNLSEKWDMLFDNIPKQQETNLDENMFTYLQRIRQERDKENRELQSISYRTELQRQKNIQKELEERARDYMVCPKEIPITQEQLNRLEYNRRLENEALIIPDSSQEL